LDGFSVTIKNSIPTMEPGSHNSPALPGAGRVPFVPTVSIHITGIIIEVGVVSGPA
jgi:hypothetical protein